MRLDDMILISTDDHAIEPPDLFERHTPARWRDRAPKVVRTPEGSDVWTYEDLEIKTIGLNAVAGWPPHEWGMEPVAFSELRDGTYQSAARVKDMSANGLLASMCFPSFARFCGQIFLNAKDKELALAMVRSYNDWHVLDWCGFAPERFIPLGIVPLWDPELMAAEVRRLDAMGCHAVTFSENPAKLGLPSLHSDHWAPFWQACDDLGTVVCLHIGSSSSMLTTADDAPVDVMQALAPVNLISCATDLVYSPVLKTYPNLRIALSEGGCGWIPFFLERIDYQYAQQRAWTHMDFGDRLPSELFKERVITCFINDPHGVEQRHKIGIDNMTWECDYPHSDTTWPRSPEVVHAQLGHLPPDEIDQITHRNAMRLWRFDPFATRPRERCTVGALRAEVAGWDTSVQSRRGEGWAGAGGATTGAMLQGQRALNGLRDAAPQPAAR